MFYIILFYIALFFVMIFVMRHTLNKGEGSSNALLHHKK